MVAYGSLPEDGPVTIGEVRLPHGHLIHPTMFQGTANDAAPVMWATDEVVTTPGAMWRDARASAQDSGLAVVLLDELGGGGGHHWDAGRPWDTGELLLSEPFGGIDGHDAASVFAERWKVNVPLGMLSRVDREQLWRGGADFGLGDFVDLGEDEEETAMFLDEVAPWGVEFPGLAVREPPRALPVEYSRALDVAPPARIGLVVAGRAADVPYLIGWQGACNHFLGGEGPELLSVMMRSWEDRFGAHLFRIGFHTMEFIVERPPSGQPSALAVAAEHYAFAGSDGLQAYPVGSVRELAEAFLLKPTWKFWWD